MNKLLIIAAALSLAGCFHRQTLLEHCTQLQRQSEVDEQRYLLGDWTKADQERHDAGFEEYFAKCRDASGHGIAPSAK